MENIEEYDYEKIRMIILGEATTLCTFFLKNNQRLTKANYAQLSRLTSMIIEGEDEVDLNDENLVVDPLIKSLILLKSQLSKDKLTNLEPFHIRPFCDVIVNKDVSGPITDRALQSILKFLTNGFIKDDDMARLIGESVTKARFVSTDSSSDEVVLMRILSVLENLIVQPFYTLSNSLVCEIMQSCFRIAFEARLTELLRKTAVKSLSLMVRALFSRISHFADEESSYKYLSNSEANQSQKMDKQSKASFHMLNRMGKRFNLKGQNAGKHVRVSKEDVGGSGSMNAHYGLACIHELLSYLTSLINPLPDGQNSDTMISVGLGLLIIIFETAVQEIGNKYILLNVVKTDLCWNIMQLLSNDKNLNTFSTVLRLAFIIFVNLRHHLKFQFEAFLMKLIEMVKANGPGSSLEIRDICLEHLLLLFRHIPFLPHELFYNFDCDLYASNLLGDLLDLFSTNCFDKSTNPNTNIVVSGLNFTTLQMLSFEVLLENLNSLQKAEKCKDECTLVPSPATALVNISHMKQLPKVESDAEQNLQNPQNVPNIVNAPNQNQHESGDEGALNSTEDLNFEMVHNSNSSLNDIDQLQPEVKSQAQNVQTNIPQQQNPESQLVNKLAVTHLFPDMDSIPKSSDEIQKVRAKKAILHEATVRFNAKPAKGIDFLKENGLAVTEDDIVHFLKNNNCLDKKQIGEYLSNRKHLSILSKFVAMFPFKDSRIDHSLRMFLEAFRLPGEAPLISMVLEQFAHHWHESNGCPFENEDAAFSLAYAIIMLNVDQHNTNAKKQTTPMNVDDFVSNLRQVNGGKDFDRQLLQDIYYMIKNNEIVMPAEQTGIIKEKYVWKCLLKNSETINGIYWHCLGSQTDVVHSSREIYTQILNRSLFEITWGPSISTLTLVFDKITPERHPKLSKRVLEHGFANCGLLCSRHGHLDDLVVTLSKFIISASRFSAKCELVAKQLFQITKVYANEMRTSWENIVEMMLFWYDHKLLDGGFSVEDFALDGRVIKFTRKLSPRQKRMLQESNTVQSNNFLSSFYSYFASAATDDVQTDKDGKSGDSATEDENNGLNAQKSDQGEMGETGSVNGLNKSEEAIKEENEYCAALIHIIDESKFLHIDSLIELIKALINVQFWEDEFDDDLEVFKLEILVKVILLNRDRLSIFWEILNKHLVKLMKFCPQSEFLTERVISAIFRLAIRFSARPDLLNDQIYVLMYQILLTFDPIMLQKNCTAQALHSFVTHCNCYLTKNEEWALVFNLILAVAIGYYPPNKKFVKNDKDDLELGNSAPESDSKPAVKKAISGFDLRKLQSNLTVKNFAESGFSVNYPYRILDVEAYAKCSEVLSLIIREYLPNSARHGLSNEQLNSYDICQMAVASLCKFVEASIKIQLRQLEVKQIPQSPKQARTAGKSRFSQIANAFSSSESDSEDESKNPNTMNESANNAQPKLSTVTENCSLKLLDLMHYLHLHATEMIGQQAEVNDIWNAIWCPILQAISFFCCDCRRPVRTYAFTFLQRTLLLHDLTKLNAQQWESCFNKILFPLLAKLLEPINLCDPIGMDETRMRTTNLLCKVFLQHLPQLHGLVTFTALWITILDFMDRYIRAEMQTDLVREAIPQSLKNILLVMKTAGIFNDTLASLTWDRINVFLPDLYQELAADLVENNGNVQQFSEQTERSDLPQAQLQNQHSNLQPSSEQNVIIGQAEGQNASVEQFSSQLPVQHTQPNSWEAGQCYPLPQPVGEPSIHQPHEQYLPEQHQPQQQQQMTNQVMYQQTAPVDVINKMIEQVKIGAGSAEDSPLLSDQSALGQPMVSQNNDDALCENNTKIERVNADCSNLLTGSLGQEQQQQHQQTPQESILYSELQPQQQQQQSPVLSQQIHALYVQSQGGIDYPLQSVSISNSYVDVNAYYSAYYAQQVQLQHMQQQHQQQQHQQISQSEVQNRQQSSPEVQYTQSSTPSSPSHNHHQPGIALQKPSSNILFGANPSYPGQAFPGTIAQFHAVNQHANYYYPGSVSPANVNTNSGDYPWPAPSIPPQQSPTHQHSNQQ